MAVSTVPPLRWLPSSPPRGATSRGPPSSPPCAFGALPCLWTAPQAPLYIKEAHTFIVARSISPRSCPASSAVAATSPAGLDSFATKAESRQLRAQTVLLCIRSTAYPTGNRLFVQIVLCHWAVRSHAAPLQSCATMHHLSCSPPITFPHSAAPALCITHVSQSRLIVKHHHVRPVFEKASSACPTTCSDLASSIRLLQFVATVRCLSFLLWFLAARIPPHPHSCQFCCHLLGPKTHPRPPL